MSKKDELTLIGRVQPGETVGELYDRLPTGVWVELPEYGVTIKRLPEEHWAPEPDETTESPA